MTNSRWMLRNKHQVSKTLTKKMRHLLKNYKSQKNNYTKSTLKRKN
jgi:hypothetical protein